jgi:hypothetical protein
VKRSRRLLALVTAPTAAIELYDEAPVAGLGSSSVRTSATRASPQEALQLQAAPVRSVFCASAALTVLACAIA